MPTFQTYNVTPILPATLEPLRELSFNLWWTWEPSARRLFRQLDPDLWDRTNHNPVRMLQLSRQSRLEELSQDKNFLRELKQVFEAFEKYLGRKDTYGKTGAGSAIKNPIAYFSAEFGFHESIPNYSGGLGILASDHCKSASDLNLNFIGIGLLYRHGYFRQQIDKEGVQEAISLNQSFYHLPIREVRRGDANLLISVPILEREFLADRLDQHRDQLAIHEADGIDAAQEPGDVVPIGVGDADGGLHDSPAPVFSLLAERMPTAQLITRRELVACRARECGGG